MFRFAAFFLALSLSSPAWAQNSLTLSEALGLAQQHSLGVLASQHRLKSTEAQQVASRASQWPSVGLQSGGGLSQHPRTGNSLDTTFSINQLLYDSNASRNAVSLADAQVRIARWTLLQTEQDALQGAAVAFYQVLRAESLSDVARETLKQAQEHLRLGVLRLKAGSGTRADLLQLQARVSAARVALISAENSVSLARLALSNQLNSPLGARPLQAKPLPLTPVRLDAAIPAALARRPEILAQALKVETGATREALERSAQGPSLSMLGKATHSTAQTGDLYAGLSFNWSLFDGRRASARAEAAREESSADRATLDQLKLAAELDIRQQYQAREEARNRVQAGQEGLKASREGYRLAVRRYELGLATQTELADAQNLLVQARESVVQSEKDLAIGEIKLRRALALDLNSLN